jgi:hypothetical protein
MYMYTWMDDWNESRLVSTSSGECTYGLYGNFCTYTYTQVYVYSMYIYMYLGIHKHLCIRYI